MQVSIDIETAGPAPTGRIIQIGAVAFEMDGIVTEPIEMLDQPGKWLDLVIEPYGWGRDDPETIEWWRSPEAADAKAKINSMPTVKIENALQMLADFMEKYLGKNAGIWAKPPAFDLVCLRHALYLSGIKCPWSMRQESCIRTAAWLAKKVPRVEFSMPDLKGKGLTKHYALHDAVEQAILAKSVWRTLVVAANNRAA